MNLLGIDYGTKRIGLAWVQMGLGVVLPYGTIQKNTLQEQVDALVALIERENVDTVVMGLPLGLDGAEHDNTARVRSFALALQKERQIAVEFVDERFTSRESDTMGGDASRDEKAAMVILQQYLGKR